MLKPYLDRRNRDLWGMGASIVFLAIIALGFGRTPEPARAGGQPTSVMRLAYFPNITHAPALAGMARGDFQRAVGDVQIDPKVVNAGPEAMEALLAGEVDVSYVGPSPAINTYLKSNGKALRLVSGACSGGASLVARKGSGIRSIGDLAGKRVAVPQIGGTQDVSCRHFLRKNGLTTLDKGGTVEVIPVKNADILALFLQKQLDAAWVPEPWAARLAIEAGATIVVDERDLWPGREFTTTVVVARTAYLEKHRADVERLLSAHRETVDWLTKSPDEAKRVVNEELKRLTGKPLPERVIQEAWERVSFTVNPHRASIDTLVEAARDAGYLRATAGDVAGMYDLAIIEGLGQ